jgi:hypothetical protein
VGWSKKYKKSIDCNNPKGFSQKAHCQGRKKREHMEINELVPNMAVVNPQAYNQLLKKQLTKTKKVGTALKNKKDPLHKRALQLVKRLIKKEMLNPPNYLRNVGNVPQNNPDGEHRFKKGKDQEESIMKSDKVENMIRNLIRTEIKKIRESQMMTEEQFDEAAGKKDACYHKVKARYDVWPSAYASGALVKCRKVGAKNWGNKSKKEGFSSDAQRKAAFASGYEEKGKKKKKESVEESYDIWMEDGSWGYTMTGLLPEAEYQGRKVKLGKPMQGDVKKFKVYVKNPKGNVVKVNFGQGGDAKGGTMRIRKSNPNARKNFRARHNCDSPGPRHKARYWSCRKW